MSGEHLTAEKSASTTHATRSSALVAELERLSGHDPVLEHLLRRSALPTADEYIDMQWMGVMPEGVDEEEQHVIDVLRELETAQRQGD